jgi:hypothetical protein
MRISARQRGPVDHDCYSSLRTLGCFFRQSTIDLPRTGNYHFPSWTARPDAIPNMAFLELHPWRKTYV